MIRRHDLSRPRTPRRRLSLGIHYEPDQFGELSEGVARFLGTARYLVVQTIIVIIWIALNAVAWSLRWDKYPFILLNLVFSTQAAYAAPLILLAQSRQADRERAQTERDRYVQARTQADTEFLSREIASVRLSLSDVATNDDLSPLHDKLDALLQRLDGNGSTQETN